MSDAFRLLMLGAMYENGGNTTHRHFDGHPQMLVYPFESQLGTPWVADHLSSVFPAKYRWPEFRLEATPEQDYDGIIDEECKVRARTPHVSKFRHWPFDFSDERRKRLYLERVAQIGRSRANNVSAFFTSTFDAWKDHRCSGHERVYVGYSPVVTVDADKIFTDFPTAVILHVVRNPWSAYADTKKRPRPLGLPEYTFGWVVNQYAALAAQERYPGRLYIVRLEDVIRDPFGSLGEICERVGVEWSDSLRVPSWNGEALEEVYPWGTIRQATPGANDRAIEELTDAERAEIRQRTRRYLEAFDYTELGRA